MTPLLVLIVGLPLQEHIGSREPLDLAFQLPFRLG